MQLTSVCVVVLLAVGIAAARLDERRGTFAVPLAGDSPFPGIRNCPKRPNVPSPNPVRMTDSLIEHVLNYIRNATLGPCKDGAHRLPSTAMSGALVVGNQTHYFNFGCVDKRTPTVAPTSDTIYRLASNSKVFAVEAVVQAFKAGHIASLSDEMRKYVPDFVVTNPYGPEQPTFRQMMSQMSALPRGGPCVACNETTDTLLARMKEYTALLFPPDHWPSYSNLAYAVLGNLLTERILKVGSFADYLARNITGPLGMTSTGLKYTNDVLARMVTNYQPDGTPAPFEKLGWLDPAGGIYSTGNDMAKWVQHFLRVWKSDPFRRQMMQPTYVNGDDQTAFGQPWEIVNRQGFMVRTKSGALPGLTTLTAWVPELDFGFTVLWNGAGIPTIPTAMGVADIVLPVLVDSYEKLRYAQFPNVSASFEKDYVGAYRGPPGLPIQVQVLRDVPDFNGKPVALLNLSWFGEYLLKPESMPPPPGVPPPAASMAESHELFQIWSRRDAAPCMVTEFGANIGEWVYFGTRKNGEKLVFVPGIQYQVFPKI